MASILRTKAVFLDRDGTVNFLRPGEYILHEKDLRLLPGVATAIRGFNALGYLVIIISNQAAIAKGKITHEDVDRIHGVLIKRLKGKNAKVDAVYYCPHHPDGLVKEYSFQCKCRKPNPGMILKALKDLHIDARKSFLVGDTTSDVLAGKRAKLKTILVATGYGGADKKHVVKADFKVRGLSQVVSILKKEK